MAWEEKYSVGLRDVHGCGWVARFYEDDWSGGSTELTATGDAFNFDFCTESDDFLEPFKESRKIISVISLTDFGLADLCTDDDMHFYVEIYQLVDESVETLRWTGYIDPSQYKEAYEHVPYQVDICCVDGLLLLRNILYAEEDSAGDTEYYNGRKLESQIILDILAKIGFTAFYEFVNLYETRMNDGVGDSLYDQVSIDVDVFKDMYCDEVLKKLLGKYNACIRQRNGIWWIYRPVELIGDIIYGRYFTGASTKAPVSFSPDQYINRSDSPSTIIQVSKGYTMIQRPAKKVTIKQDYGNKESWIDNWEFEGETYDPDTGTWENWTKSGGFTGSITSYLPNEIDGCVLPGTSPARAYSIYQQFGAYLLETTDVLGFAFDYLVYNFSGGDLTVSFYIGVRAADNSWFLNQYTEDYVAWTEAPNFVFFAEVFAAGISEWKTFDRKLEGLPINGPYIVTLYSASSSSVAFAVGFKNIKLFSNSTEMAMLEKEIMIPVRQKSFSMWNGGLQLQPGVVRYMGKKIKSILIHIYEKLNAINGREIGYEMLLGDVTDANIDNIIEQFAGALAVITGIDEANSTARMDTITVTVNGSVTVTCDGLTKSVNADLTINETLVLFRDTWQAAWNAIDVGLSVNVNDLILTSTSPGVDFTGETVLGGTCTGSVATTIENVTVYALAHTTEWHTRDGIENLPLLQIMCNEIAAQYERQKKLIQMPIQETASELGIDIMGNIMDVLNTYPTAGYARIFVINRGSFDVRNRRWELDLFEIGDKYIESGESGESAITVDTTHITVDDTTITVDHT